MMILKFANKFYLNEVLHGGVIILGIFLSGCQSIPPVADQDGVIHEIIQHDQVLNAHPLEKNKSLDASQADRTVLSESDAVHLALHHNASFQALLIDLKLAKADLVEAGLLPNPELLFAFGMPNKPYRYAIDLPLEALWLRPIKLRTMKHAADATAYRLTQSGLNLIRDVRVAYAQAVLAQEKLSVAESAYQLKQNIYQLSLKRLEAGDINGRDILLAENDAAIAKRDWELARFDIEIKRETLMNLMGTWPTASPPTLSPNISPACQAVEIDQLLAKSLDQRPDIVSARYAIDAAKERIKLSKVSWLKFTGTADATSGQETGHTLGPAIRSSIPILNRNQGGVSRAEAELERAELNLTALQQQARLEIKNAHLQYEQSCHDWQVLQNNLLPAIQNNIQLTKQAYEAGDISYLQTLEANRQYIDLEMRQVQLKADLVGKWAELTRNLSRKKESQKHAY